MKTSKFVELRPKREYLNPKFENYVLSTRKCEVRRLQIESPKKFSLSKTQYGLQHALVTANVDRLIRDSFTTSRDQLYYFAEQGTLIKMEYSSRIGTVKYSEPVASITYTESENSYPPSLVFPDLDYAVISNGSGQLFIYKTQQRAENLEWSLVYEMKTEENEESTAYVVVDARSMEQNKLSVLLQTVNKYCSSSHFYSSLLWLDLDLDVSNVVRRREVKYTGVLKMATLNYNATELITVGSGKAKLTSDTEKQNLSQVEDVEMAEPEKPAYVWTQNAEEITITFALGEHIDKKDVNYKLNSAGITVKVKDRTLLEGALEGAVHADSSVWTIGGESLELTVFKARGHFWRTLVPTDSRGVYEPDPYEVSKALESLEKFTTDSQALSSSEAEQSTFNVEQMEECDATEDQPTFIHWLQGDSHELTQTVDISNQQILFQTRLQPGGPKNLCTRYEHDGIVWSVDELDLGDGERIGHKFTLNAFGYIQASHSNKISSNCAQDGNFAFVVHGDHHLFVYLQNVPVGGDTVLKNRKTGKTCQTYAEQLVISTSSVMKPTDGKNILGVAHSNSSLYVMTDDAIIACQIRTED
ncbi:unnamed protein product [Bursaphelenchus okinawaensis]|uniref:NudC domain-containing protein 1 n=1 Tax=Bursaphelenchus okinawaensis TaxID=465554 RepID=A0A811LMY0_9BILA|nr:unnamed protein product [Bursaphelenchus okinawaensis]CAG9124286.1 unnamed protein product [Bursaphelenchus okinawaensis]